MILVVMGVTACGKTTLGKDLAEALGLPFLDGDDFHPAANREKMAHGEPLGDADRDPWLQRLASEMAGWERMHHGAVLACSALKERYRTILRSGSKDVRFVYLHCTPQMAADRARLRTDHDYIAKDVEAIVAGQFRDLEHPTDSLQVSAELPHPAQVAAVLADLDCDALLVGRGGPDEVIDSREMQALLDRYLAKLPPIRRALIVPPDYTRLHSGAGEITVHLYRRLLERGASHVHVLPALGTHHPMTKQQRHAMYPGVPDGDFRVHHWRDEVAPLGELEPGFIEHVSGGRVSFPVRAEVNRLLLDGHYDWIFSVGQLVPHEVVGIANHNKNIFVGVGGFDTINKSHFLGAVCNMEMIMGRADTPVRAVLDEMSRRFGPLMPPISYVQTVRSRHVPTRRLVTRALYCGRGKAPFQLGAPVAREANLTLLDEPLRKVVVYLDPKEFTSTWLGNKAVYRLRCAMADDGELIVLGPGVESFGEDPHIDALIRQYGYHGTESTLRSVAADPNGLGSNLSAAAHLIHGSSEGRFRITWAPGRLSREEVEGVGYAFGDLNELVARYDPATMADGPNRLSGGDSVYFVSNPALGLWSLRSRFED